MDTYCISSCVSVIVVGTFKKSYCNKQNKICLKIWQIVNKVNKLSSFITAVLLLPLPKKQGSSAVLWTSSLDFGGSRFTSVQRRLRFPTCSTLNRELTCKNTPPQTRFPGPQEITASCFFSFCVTTLGLVWHFNYTTFSMSLFNNLPFFWQCSEEWFSNLDMCQLVVLCVFTPEQTNGVTAGFFWLFWSGRSNLNFIRKEKKEQHSYCF